MKVFYSVGFTGLTFCIDVITTDTSTLRNRGLAFAFTSSPYIITAFGGPAASEDFYGFNWRWAYGCFAIILPVVALPMFGLLQYNRHKAKKKGLLYKKERSDRTVFQSIIFYIIEFDREHPLFAPANFANVLSPGSRPSGSWPSSFPPSLHTCRRRGE